MDMTSYRSHFAIRLAGYGAILAAVLMGSACSTTLDVPRADNYPASSQKKVRAVHHWDVLADDVAERIAHQVRNRNAALEPVYVVPASDTPFHQGFRNLLLTRLMQNGVPIAMQPGELEVTFETQLVQHPSKAANAPPLPFTTLAAGVAVARDIALYTHSASSGILTGLAIGAAMDGLNFGLNGTAAGGPTRTEVLVTTSLASRSVYLARTSDVYYIEQIDSSLYSPEPRTLVRQWQVMGD